MLTHVRLVASIILSGFLSLLSAPAGAQITVGGDPGQLSPAYPGWWNYYETTAQVGIDSGKTGSFTVASGSYIYGYLTYLGYNAGSSGTANITGVGSAWTNRSDLDIGYYGNGTLNIQAGGGVASYDGSSYLGYNSGSVGTATVNGNGSIWINSTVYIGYSGSGKLSIQAGGQVITPPIGSATYWSYLGYNSGSVGTATVTGSGSQWANNYDLYVGYSGSGTLNAQAGGQITSSSGYLGYNSGSIGTATISGSGSQWVISHGLYVGYSGSGKLTVADGGSVSASTLYASLSDLFGNGTITATRGAVLDADMVFDATHGLTQTMPFGTGGTLSLTAASGDLGAGYKGTGTLRIADGMTITSDSGFLGHEPGSTGTATVTGNGSTWNNSHVYVGYSGSGTLNVQAGGQVSSSSGYLGCNLGSIGTATITGAGSRWINSGDLYVGNSGSGKLTVADGGSVSASTLYASLHDLSGNGSITITQGALLDADIVFDATRGLTHPMPFGIGGTLNLTASASGLLGAGYKGLGSLRIADGIAVASSNGYLGYNSGSDGAATVSGTGSQWSVTSLYVGYAGNGALNVQAGGQVSSTSSYLGDNTGSTGTATVTGGGAQWSTSSLYVGFAGMGTLNVQAGGQVSSSYGYLGHNTGSVGTAIVTGAGSQWSCDSLFIGGSGTGKLTVSNGGLVTAGMLYASMSDLAGNGTITVTQGAVLDADMVFDAGHGTTQAMPFGTGGVLNLTVTSAPFAEFGAGYKGMGSLRIADGVRVESGVGCLGYSSGSIGTATVTGAGSTWAMASYYESFSIGYNGVGTLTVKDGGTVTSYGANIGYKPGSSGMVTVTGSGSTWTDSAGINMVGDPNDWTSGRGAASLTVANGGVVTTRSLWTAANDLHGDGTIYTTDLLADMPMVLDAAHGSAISFGTGGKLYPDVDGAGVLAVGYRDTGSLRVADGQKITSYRGYLGYYPGSSGTAVVTGAGSTWSSIYGLYVGSQLGYSNSALTIGNGGKVTAQSLTISYGEALNLHVSGNAMLVVGDASTRGSITNNNGKVNLYADAFLAPGTYSPVTEYSGKAISWSGYSTYNHAYGGTWNATAKTFTVGPVVASDAGVPNGLTAGERVLVTDPATGKRVGASFGAVAGGTNFLAVPLAGADLSGLPDDQGVLGAWYFNTNLTGDQALLSFDVGAGRSDLEVWQCDGSVWKSFPAPDLTYGDDGIADFSVTAFNLGYALTVAKHLGDANNDGNVNVIDLGMLARNYDTAAGATWAMGDFNRDGAVDVVDLGALAKYYDWTGAPAGAIPEPGTLSLLALSGLALLRRLGRR